MLKSKRNPQTASASILPTDYYGLPTQDTMSGSTLAQHYIPDKITPSPSYWGSEARKASRKATGGWGAAAGSRRDSQGSILNTGASIKGNGVLFRPAYQEYVDSSGSSSAVYLATNPIGHSSSSATVLGPPSSGHRNRKWGAGREAWGKDGGGDPKLGAGNFEDDDGIDLVRDQDQGDDGERSVGTGMSSTLQSDKSAATSSLIPSIIAVSVEARKSRVRWNRFKWTLVVANTLLTIYSFAGFIAVLLFWAGMYQDSKVLAVLNTTEMALGLIAMILCVIVCIVGWAGILLNNRSFLSAYTFLLWLAFIFIVAPGYLAYKKRTFNLSGKVNQIWSTGLTLSERQLIQRSLNCCGYYSPFIEAAADSFRCFARSTLPGCKGPIIDFQKKALQYVYVCSFGIVPCHLAIIVIALLCSDHITYRFGKGVTPKEYRVDDTVIKSALGRQSLLPQSLDSSSEKNPFLSTPRPPFWDRKSEGAGTPSSSGSSIGSFNNVKVM